MQKRVLSFLFATVCVTMGKKKNKARAYEEEVLIPEREREREKKCLLLKSTRSKSDVVLLTRVGSKKKKESMLLRHEQLVSFYLSLPSPAVKVVPTANYLSKDLQVSSNKKKR